MRFFKQDTGYSCGPAVMQMILCFYGKMFSEDTLVEKLKTKKGDGTKHQPMIDLACEEGLFVYVNNESSLFEIQSFLKRRIPVAVHFIEPSCDEGHYAVVVGMKDDDVILHDPWNGEGFMMNVRDFDKRWYSEDGTYRRWMMAVSDTDMHMGRCYLPD